MSLTLEQKHQLLSKIETTVNKRFYDPSLDGQKWSELLAQHKRPNRSFSIDGSI
jgi:hypothetical protein